jgi:hypothetical protein
MSNARICSRSFGFCALVLAALATALKSGAQMVPAPNPVFALPTLEPIPSEVAGVAPFLFSLDGQWKLNLEPPANFWTNDVDPASWSDVTVPTRPDRRAPRPVRPYAYKRRISVPSGFAGHAIVLRFEGVSCATRVWIDGVIAGEHWGTFTAWSCDVTRLLRAGTDAWVTVEVDDRATGLAQFLRPGGLIRDVGLIAVPVDHLTRLQVETTFGDSPNEATMHLRLKMAVVPGDSARLALRLMDPEGKPVEIQAPIVDFSPEKPELLLNVPVHHPQKWDAEHPSLYKLEARALGPDGNVTEVVARSIGFREVHVVGNQMMVNGLPVKLRGIWGNSDVAALKEVNVNHSRQKYVTESFLDDADRLGLYVLDEVPVDFAKYGAEIDPKYASEWLELIADLMERDRNHPSVIMWGLGNESFSGPNVLNTFHFVKAEDLQRPALFSWANRVPAGEELPYSVYSVHYPNLNDPTLDLGDFNVAIWHSPSLVRARVPKPVMPVLQDEYAHVILNDALIERDPNVRNFWGESILRYWEKIFPSEGALGGDQFGMGLGLGHGNLPGGPEYYLLKEAYSPVRLPRGPLRNPGAGQPLSVPIKNWYDHTNLSEVSVFWSVGPENGRLSGPDLKPHASGALEIPARGWRDGDILLLKVVEASGHVAAEAALPVSPPKASLPAPSGPAPALTETASEIRISGTGFQVVFDKYRGLLKEASVNGSNVVIDGPFLTLLGSGLAYGEWWCDSIHAHAEGPEVVVDIKGNYAVIAASFQVRVDGHGLITTHYSVDHVPGKPPAPTYSPWNATSVGGYSEVGVSFVMPADVDRLSWKRIALWSAYPADHIGRPEGVGVREPSTGPSPAWAQLEFPAGAGANDWRAMKENILEAAAWKEGSRAELQALSDGSTSVRLQVDPGYRALQPGVRMLLDSNWNYEDFGLGNYTRPPLLIHDGYSGTVFMRLVAR